MDFATKGLISMNWLWAFDDAERERKNASIGGNSSNRIFQSSKVEWMNRESPCRKKKKKAPFIKYRQMGKC